VRVTVGDVLAPSRFYIKTSCIVLAETQLFSAGLQQFAGVRGCAAPLAAASGRQPPAAAPEVDPELRAGSRAVQPAGTSQQRASGLPALFLNAADTTVKHRVEGMIEGNRGGQTA